MLSESIVLKRARAGPAQEITFLLSCTDATSLLKLLVVAAISKMLNSPAALLTGLQFGFC